MKVFFDFRYASYVAAYSRVEEPFDVVPIALITFGSYREIDPPESGRSSGKNAWGRAENLEDEDEQDKVARFTE